MTANILIFDSGVGGLSILTEIRQRCAGLSLHYLMDNHAFPYGTKADDYLIRRILDVCQSAVAELQPDILVIACNTASTLALAELRKQLSIPVVGVVPAIKVAAMLAPNGHIGLLATPATVHRTYTDLLIQDFAQGCEVRRMGSSALVQWVEDFICQAKPPKPEELQAHLHAWLTTPPTLSHVVLGCTHFPLLKPLLAHLWPQVHWVDSGEAIARRVETLLGQKACALKNTPPAPLYLYWTAHFAPPAGVLAYLNQLGQASAQGILAVETSV